MQNKKTVEVVFLSKDGREVKKEKIIYDPKNCQELYKTVIFNN